jgi:hypothetical protein
MVKKMLGLVTIGLILFMVALSWQSQSAYAQGDATAEATEEASPYCGTSSATLDANAPKQQPRAATLARGYGVSYEEIIGWFCKGYGFGQIDLAYAVAKASGGGTSPLTVAQVFVMRDADKGWREIAGTAGLTMKDVQHARRMAHKNGQNQGHGNGKGNKHD